MGCWRTTLLRSSDAYEADSMFTVRVRRLHLEHGVMLQVQSTNSPRPSSEHDGWPYRHAKRLGDTFRCSASPRKLAAASSGSASSLDAPISLPCRDSSSLQAASLQRDRGPKNKTPHPTRLAESFQALCGSPQGTKGLARAGGRTRAAPACVHLVASGTTRVKGRVRKGDRGR